MTAVSLPRTAVPAAADSTLMQVEDLGFRYSRMRPWLFRHLAKACAATATAKADGK